MRIRATISRRFCKAKGKQPLDMVRYGERFFTSLGFAPLPKTFWERSLFVKPRDREVVCHASAWDVDQVDDLRFKMCIEINAEDFSTIHHELGHNFYQRAYDQQPFLFRDSANDGFHEAIGDTIALSVTPEYLKKIGLLANVPDESKDIGLLLYKALEKIAFLPFGLMIDKWRWQVFSGEVPPEKYNESVVAAQVEISGRGAAGGADGGGFRSGREISRSGERAVRAIFSGGHSAVPISSGAGEGGGLQGSAESVFHLWEQGGGGPVECDACDGSERAVAEGAGGVDGAEGDGCDGDPGLFRAAAAMVG